MDAHPAVSPRGSSRQLPKFSFEEGQIIDTSTGKEVMMEWERPLMQIHAGIVCRPGGDILEVGFGMGISAGYIQELQPKTHTIVERHPQVLERLYAWAADRPNVIVVEGDWFEISPQLGQYDGIFFDTFEDSHYYALPFHVKKWLRPGGIFSFFNGKEPRQINCFGIPATYVKTPVNPPPNTYFTEYREYWAPVITYEAMMAYDCGDVGKSIGCS